MINLSHSEADPKKEKGKRVCPHCGSNNLDFEDGQLVCMDCGAVIADNTVSSEQEQFYSYEEAVERSRHSFTSEVTPQTKTDRKNLRLAISIINDLVNKLHLPYFIKEEAIKLYRRMMEKASIRKNSVAPTSAALVYLVCRKSRISLPFERVSKESDVSRSNLIGSYMKTIETLKIDVPPPSVEGLALLFAKKADLTPKTIALARKIAKKLKNEFVDIGKDPNGIAAAAVYTAAKRNEEKATQKEIARIASITEVTIRNRFLEVKKAMEKLEL